ncbi:DUF6578 domain-containing protein [Kocuria sp. M1N1S27]|uniref:DUF6578 domain-containing protein n=1 Tax=Kocuria kalidii TaxID=3376283 RepID=UPI0037A37A86
MMIEVELREWEQQCCGDPFRVGSTVTWKLVARDPSEGSDRPMPGYWKEHHDQTPEHEVPAYRVKLEVAEDAELPAYVADDQDDWFEQD